MLAIHISIALFTYSPTTPLPLIIDKNYEKVKRQNLISTVNFASLFKTTFLMYIFYYHLNFWTLPLAFLNITTCVFEHFIL